MQKSLVSVKMKDTLMATSVCVVATSLAPTVKSTREQVSTGILQSHCMLVQLMIFIAFTQAPFLLFAVASHTA